jgi:hypothetical protein
LPTGSWNALWTVIEDLRPDAAEELRTLIDRTAVGLRDYDPDEAAIVGQERDAVGLALQLFGSDRRPAMDGWTPPPAGAMPPFFLSLDQPVLSEDQMIQHDAQIFVDWPSLRAPYIGALTFYQRDEKLTVINVNRGPVEHTLGVDLLYYNHLYGSFVFVQYKRMLDEHGTATFRPTGPVYARELERMRAADATTFADTPPRAPDEYRLWPRAFFFKLCPDVGIAADATSLIKGMYLPLDYWFLITTSPGARGPRGGVAITYANTGRWINNSLFTDLVRGGWVGSTGAATHQLDQIVAGALQRRHSVVVAISAPTDLQ